MNLNITYPLFIILALSACDISEPSNFDRVADAQLLNSKKHRESVVVANEKAIRLTFYQAKKQLPVIFEGMEETFYCGCSYTGKEVNLASCGYQVRKNENRASRIEWEHVVPAWVIGHQRQCWQDGGRKNCTKSDEVFKYAEGDLNNLVPSIGEVNGDRSNYSFSQWTNNTVNMYGKCQTIVDFKARKIQPRKEVRGRVARIYFYMSDTYDLKLSKQDTQLFCAWAKMYPVDSWEIERNKRIVEIQGKGNEYVSKSGKVKNRCF